MQKFIHNIALLAALAALSVGLWQDWGVLLTLQRVAFSYVGFFALGVILVLVVRSVPADRGNDQARPDHGGGSGPQTD